MFEKYENDFEQRILKNMNSLTSEIKQEIDKNTPIDTWNLIQNTKTVPAVIQGSLIVGKIENAVDYARYVEYWLWRPYHYHKNGSIFYTGVGARMFTRAFDKYRGKIISKLLE